MLASSLEYNKIFGRVLTGKIYGGSIRIGDKIKALNLSKKTVEEARILKLISRVGLQQAFVESADAGDIVSVAGFTKAGVTDTLCAIDVADPISVLNEKKNYNNKQTHRQLQAVVINNKYNKYNKIKKTTAVDPPIVSVNFSVNDSPIAGREGKFSSGLFLRERLLRESEHNISITVRQSADKESFQVMGRGELQIGVLVETMRREGFELSISPPRILLKKGPKGELLEPIEEVIIDVPDEYANTVIEKLTSRRCELKDFKQGTGKSRLIFLCPVRALIGYRVSARYESNETKQNKI